jgi:hypothetical protein
MPEILREPVDHPCAWKGPDMARDQSWIRQFSHDEIAELDAALQGVKAKGLGPFGFTRSDFPLPTFAAALDAAATEIEYGRGIVLMRGLDFDSYGFDDIRALYWGIGLHLGTAVSQNPLGEMMAEVTDRGFDRRNNNVRGYTTNQRQNYHCDAADCVGLLCIHPAKAGGESRLASSISIYNHILETHPEYIEPLCAGFHFDLRGEGVTGERDEVTFNKVPVYSYFDGLLSCRYNGKTIPDGMDKAGEPMTPLQRDAVQYVREVADMDAFRLDMKFQRGDIQFVSNHTSMHARNAYEDWDDPERKRRLLRLWLTMHNGRALAPEFAERHNTGPRGGIHVKDGAGYWADEKYYAGEEAARP